MTVPTSTSGVVRELRVEAVVRLESLFPLISGYEDVGGGLRLYVEGPTPTPSLTRSRGVRTPLFHLFTGADAEEITAWLARNRAWQCLRVPPAYRRERGVRAVLVASEWHCGEASALFAFSRDRVIADDAHRLRLQREVRVLIASVIENPVKDGELQDLQLVEDVVNVAPLGVEVASTAEVVTAFFESA